MALKQIVLVCCLLLSSVLKAQNVDSILKKLSVQLGLSDSATYAPDLFLHIDRTVYLSNEPIWFAAYLINGASTAEHHTLHVLLVNTMSQKVAASQNFVLENGTGGGSFHLPDSLQTGEYSLMAYTNQYPAQSGCIFRQPVSITGPDKPLFDIKFSGSRQGDSLRLGAKVLSQQGGIAAGATIRYAIYADGKLYRQQQQNTDADGQVTLNIPAPYSTQYLAMRGEVKQGKAAMPFNLPIAWEPAQLQIRFFPEGGNLTAGQPARVAFEIKSGTGKAVSAACSLLEDGKAIASFTSDLYGRGMFTFTPLQGKSYMVKPEGQGAALLQQFPAVSRNAWNLHIARGIVSDTLELSISGPSAGSECIVFIHNNRQMLYGSYIALPREKGLLRVPVSDLQRGLATVCIFNKQGALQCQRAVLLSNKNSLTAAIEADSAVYHPLSKVNLRVKLRNAQGKPVKGIFSFAAVVDKSLDNRFTDIVRFNTYDRFLPLALAPQLPPWTYLIQERHAEQTLLTLQQRQAKDTAAAGTTGPAYDGYVRFNDRPLKKPVSLLLSGSTSQIFSTDDRGYFILPYLALRAEAGSNVLLSVMGKSPVGYSIIMQSPLKKTDDALAATYFMPGNFSAGGLSAAQQRIMSFNKSIALKEVVIKGQQEGRKGFYGKINSSGNCNDYVCARGTLNCRAHPSGSPGTRIPVDGETYYIQGLMRMEPVVYHCQYQGMPPYIQTVKATAYPSQFYPFSPADDNLPEVLKQSTLHWQSFIHTDEKGEATISFYTNQLTGMFRGVVQGIAESGVFSTAIELNVSK